MKALNFNPRPRKEGDPVALSVITAAVNFNPRPRKEGDVVKYPVD